MIDTPHIVAAPAQQTAAIHLTIPRDEIRTVMGPAIGEVMQAVAAQGMRPAGPVFSYHFQPPGDTFDFEVGVPVTADVAASGRVKQSALPATRVARTIYRGPYEGLGAAWGEFIQWIEGQGLKSGPALWESYVTGPESGSDASKWETELNRPLLD